MGMVDGSAVMGWGYEGRTPADLIDDARAWGVSTVVDVRLTPLSRKAGFSKRALAAALGAAGVAYVHLPALGNPRDNRAGFADTVGEVGANARRRFVDEVIGQPPAQVALDEVAALSQSGRVILLCFEASEGTCHRQLVLDALRDRVAESVPV